MFHKAPSILYPICPHAAICILQGSPKDMFEHCYIIRLEPSSDLVNMSSGCIILLLSAFDFSKHFNV